MIDAALGLLGLLAHPSPPPSPPSDLDSGFLGCDTTVAFPHRPAAPRSLLTVRRPLLAVGSSAADSLTEGPR